MTKCILGGLAAIALLAVGPAFAQSTGSLSRPAPNSCGEKRLECVRFNQSLNVNTSRCDGYYQACLRSGTWEDRRRRFTNLRRS